MSEKERERKRARERKRETGGGRKVMGVGGEGVERDTD